MYWLIVFAVVFGSCEAIIYKLNDSDYYRMPPLYGLDDYTSCMIEADGTYCLGDFGLKPDDSELYKMIKEYSDFTLKHFNHTLLHRGVCLTRSCSQYYKRNGTDGVKNALEACVNETIWREYKLQVRLENIQYCNRGKKKIVLDYCDFAVAIVYVIILTLNSIGTIYDTILRRKNEKSGNRFLLAFSVRRNWKKLVASSSKGPDPRLERLKLFHGLRTMTMVCVFFSHTVLVMAYAYVENPLYIEEAYEDPLKQILFNGSLVTHTFFVMSSFLLSYNLMIYSEKHTVGWMHWPKGVLLRWLRLTPAYALVIATIATWMRHFGSGPMWDMLVSSEAIACREYWWSHILYINNYLYKDTFCLPQTWYLAADTQLFVLGLLLCIVFRSKRARVIALAASFCLAITIVVLHTYYQDLDPVVLQRPESYRSLYATDNTFRLMYIRGHTNLSTYTLGLAGGFIAYYWQQQKKDVTPYRRYRLLFWPLLLMAVGILLSGGLFYGEGPRVSTWLRLVYAAIYKPLFQILVVLFIVASVFKYESLYRPIVEWRGWAWSGRVSYCAFLLHTIFQRGLVGAQARSTYMSDYYVMVVLMATIVLSYISACALYLLVEAPAGGVTRALTTPKERAPNTDPPPDERNRGVELYSESDVDLSHKHSRSNSRNR